MVLLQLFIMKWKTKEQVKRHISVSLWLMAIEDLLAVVKKIMRQIVANIPENPSTIHQHGRIPVVRKDGVGKFVEWGCKNQE
jgi:hypothetical protein